MIIKYEKRSLKSVIQSYIDGFEADIYEAEWFIDQSKDTIIFRLFINDDSAQDRRAPKG